MARDYAKRGSAQRTRKAPAAKRKAASHSAGGGWRWYGAGVLTGVFLSFLVYLGSLPQAEPGGPQPTAASAKAEPAPEPRFDFYTMLPGESIDEDYKQPAAAAAEPSRPTPAEARIIYLLQAGSFRQSEDAERRRAELILLGLEPSIEETRSDNGRWFRVYLGPFDTHAKMSRARGLTAGQGIDTLLMKRPAG
ncbi:SPOR domain-containing protein [Haliea sp. E17]|uniref:SPOR domain-containing protein n=1 Tax=Haliea sp. E17 TaxID=3401576 RepID=UPI003AAA326D